MERVPPPRQLFQVHAFYPQVEKMQKQEANGILYCSGPHEQWARRGEPRFVDTTKGTVQVQMEINRGCIFG